MSYPARAPDPFNLPLSISRVEEDMPANRPWYIQVNLHIISRCNVQRSLWEDQVSLTVLHVNS
jgi:hypothetical protein